MRKPAAMSFEQAAAIPQAGMLAVQGLIDLGGIGAGQKLLLNGAGGGVGTFAVQIAKLHGAEVTAIDKRVKLAMLRTIGADHVIDCSEEDFARGQKCYDLILDVKSQRSPFACARALNPGGTYVTVGGDTSRLIQSLLIGPLIARTRGKQVRVLAIKPNKDLAYMSEIFEAGDLLPVLDGPYRLADLPEALRHFETGDHQGKIIITME